jgi:hypothetical protein
MKTLITIIQILVIIIIANTSICSQSAGDYRSLITGNWNTASTWETYNGSSWIPAVTPPTGSENITVDDSVNVDVAVNISGYVILSGDGNIEIGTGSLTFGNGSTYEHARISGGIPVSTWATGSTCKITGITNQAPANRNQSFYNLIWDCPNQSGNFNMGFDEDTIGGDISIINTGASSRLYLCAPAAGDTATVVINGNIIQTGGQFSSNGSGNAAFIEITVNGDITVSNGNFSVSRGSQGGTGTTKWYLHGSNFSMTDATTQNSNAAGAKFIFSGTTQQNLSLNNVTFSGGFPIEVAANAILDVGTSQIAGSGIFTLNDGATLQTANVAGLDSTLQNTGIITLGTAANYTFNGSAVQVTGNILPFTVNDLTVNNSAGVTPSHDMAVHGNLNVNSGDLNLNGYHIDLGTTGTLIETPGNTVTGQTGIISAIRDLNAPSGVNLAGLGAMFTSTDNLSTTLVERFHSPAIGNGNQGILRQYSIAFIVLKDGQKIIKKQNSIALATTMRFYYDESELNGIPETDLTLFSSNSGMDSTWEHMGGTVNTTNNYVEIADVINFGWWTFADINAPIPVELISFTANVVDGLVNLSWATATELNNSGWDIERRADNDKEGSWVKVGFVKGVGNSTEVKQYKFIDQNNVTGNYSYRLKQIDFNGTITYSNIVEISVTGPDKFELCQNYPNPFNPETSIRFEVPSSSFVNISVYNMIGEKVVTLVNENMEQGVYSRKLSAENLSSGIYIYRLTAGNTTITKKMTLLK